MPKLRVVRFQWLICALLLACGSAVAQSPGSETMHGTLVVAVPVREGLVACSDKRLFNADAGTYTDNSVKIREAAPNALFVATNTVGFYDPKSRTMAFNATEITSKYVANHDLASGRVFWDGLKKEISDRLHQYFSQRKYADWPESDKANNNLLFNLVFYTISQNSIRSYTVKVFYEKAQTPVIYISDPVSELVKTPKLSGKGREVMYSLSSDPSMSRDPSILRFDETVFNAQNTSVSEAVDFARKLFFFTNAKVPQAEVSATYDCSLLSYQGGFQWLTASALPTDQKSAK